MNPNELEAGPELDALVAERVMGWKRSERSGHFRRPISDDFSFRLVFSGPGRPADAFVEHWHPSTDISAAWEVLAVVRGWIFSRRRRFVAELQRTIAHRMGMQNVVPPEGELVLLVEPIDICRAALAAKSGGETE